MPRLSAIDSVNPALARVKWMLLPFRLTTWLKVGLIGWLAGEAISSSGGVNYRFPGSLPGGGSIPPVSLPNIHFPVGLAVVVAVIAALVAVISLVMLYVSCRFRFVLFDSVIHGQASIERGWSAYRQAANRYFGFLVVFWLAVLAAAGLIAGLPLWRAYKRGVFDGGDIMGPVLMLIGSILAGLAVLFLAAYLVYTALRDFVAPLLALDDLPLAKAWRAVWNFIKAEPGAFAGYIAMKLLLAIAASILIAVALMVCFFVLLLPLVIVVVLMMAIASAFKSAVAIAIAGAFSVVLFLVFVALMFGLIWIVSAPVSVFFESYRLCFFAGRYPKLEALVWPQTVAPQGAARA